MRDDILLDQTDVPLERRLERSRGAARLCVGPGGVGAPSRLVHLHQESPCRILFPREEPGDPFTAVLLTTSGGIAGGDRLGFAVEVQAGGQAVVTTQAAEKIYRSLGLDASIDVALSIGEGAWLEWLPQETILFDRARLTRRNAIDVAPGGRLMALETIVFGRAAHGERFASGRIFDSWRVRCDGKLRWADGLRLDGDIDAVIARPAGLDGATAIATVIFVADDAPAWLEIARALLDGTTSRSGVTVVNGILLARFIARDARELRSDIAHFCASFRHAVAGLPPRMPRVWLT